MSVPLAAAREALDEADDDALAALLPTLAHHEVATLLREADAWDLPALFAHAPPVPAIVEALLGRVAELGELDEDDTPFLFPGWPRLAHDLLVRTLRSHPEHLGPWRELLDDPTPLDVAAAELDLPHDPDRALAARARGAVLGLASDLPLPEPTEAWRDALLASLSLGATDPRPFRAVLPLLDEPTLREVAASLPAEARWLDAVADHPAATVHALAVALRDDRPDVAEHLALRLRGRGADAALWAPLLSLATDHPDLPAALHAIGPARAETYLLDALSDPSRAARAAGLVTHAPTPAVLGALVASLESAPSVALGIPLALGAGSLGVHHLEALVVAGRGLPEGDARALLSLALLVALRDAPERLDEAAHLLTVDGLEAPGLRDAAWDEVVRPRWLALLDALPHEDATRLVRDQLQPWTARLDRALQLAARVPDTAILADVIDLITAPPTGFGTACLLACRPVLAEAEGLDALLDDALRLALSEDEALDRLRAAIAPERWPARLRPERPAAYAAAVLRTWVGRGRPDAPTVSIGLLDAGPGLAWPARPDHALAWVDGGVVLHPAPPDAAVPTPHRVDVPLDLLWPEPGHAVPAWLDAVAVVLDDPRARGAATVRPDTLGGPPDPIRRPLPSTVPPLGAS